MLDSMRAATQSWIGRGLMAMVMGLIILSFVIWGIGDIFRGFGAGGLAKVGSVEITAAEFRDAYQSELLRMQRRARRNITPAEARKLGLDRQLLSRLVSEAALDQQAQKLGLAVSDKDITKAIMNDPSFKGPTGRFDKQKFEQLLRDNGFTEKTFVREQRSSLLRSEIADALTYGLEIPKAMLAAIHRFQAEVRSADYMELPVAGVSVPAPSPDQLQSYFNDRRASFATHEYRDLVVLTLTPALIAKPDQISDADAQKRYDEVKNEKFGSPEKRAVEQILFPDEAAAAQARARIGAGTSFDAILKEKNLTAKDASLGTVARDGLVDKNVADAAFALAQGEVSGPVKAQFGTVLVRVTSIVPASLKPFPEVSAELKREIAAQRARTEVDRLHDAIEDQRASGKSLTEAAKGAGLEPRIVASVDAAGLNPKGADSASGLENRAPLLKAAFASDVGVDNDTLRVPAGGYQWFEVAKTDKAREKTLEEVKPEVEKAWRDDETAKLMAAKADELVKKINAGETLAAVAAAEGNVKVKHVANIKRTGAEGLPVNITPRIFDTPVRGAGSFRTDDGGRILFQVVDSVVSPVDYESADLVAVKDTVKGGLIDDVLAEYLAKLEDELGVKVNAAAFAAAGGGSNEPADLAD
ncbi:peptidylprolyl isomerase [Methylocapsa palsarum]|uniref:Parvulin-like PPIase n=1 Tax=Methylocapsa palsarum TaxID=1612308 RepID=A0A1I3Y9Q6_9HYPH|nr:peptidylprolyl isomerase [Methylocapsa palsarum]SFK27936.1 peptidyl-prolyl cis-trans isomerase D [Methylocapsa palsarum]